MVKDKRVSKLAISSLIFSLLFFVPFFPILGLIIGIIALNRISKDHSLKGKTIAIVAIITGALFSIISILLFSIGALAYFGVLTPEKFLPEKCLLSAGFFCKSFKVEAAAGVTLLAESSMPTDITITKLEFKDKDTILCSGTFTTELKSGESATFVSSCSPTLTSGSRFKADIVVTYDEVDGLTDLVKTGSILGKVI